MSSVSGYTYVETSVFGGVFDEEFRDPSTRLFEQGSEGSLNLTTSELVRAELEPAPERVSRFFLDSLVSMEVASVTAEAIALQQAYLKAGILGESSMNDALHVALATTNDCAVIVSWNFRHIVHLDKIERYNEINTLEGWGTIEIRSPREIVTYEDENI